MESLQWLCFKYLLNILQPNTHTVLRYSFNTMIGISTDITQRMVLKGRMRHNLTKQYLIKENKYLCKSYFYQSQL